MSVKEGFLTSLARDVLLEVLVPLLDLSSLFSLALTHKEFYDLLSPWDNFPEPVRFGEYVRRCETEMAVHRVASLLVAAIRRGALAQFHYFCDYFSARETLGSTDVTVVYAALIEADLLDEADRFVAQFGGIIINAHASVLVALGLSGNIETVEWFLTKWNSGKPYHSNQLSSIVIGAAARGHTKLLSFLFARGCKMQTESEIANLAKYVLFASFSEGTHSDALSRVTTSNSYALFLQIRWNR